MQNPWYQKVTDYVKTYYPEDCVDTHWKTVQQTGWITCTKGKPHCFLCNYSCNSRTTMYKHIFIKHPEWANEKDSIKEHTKKFECLICRASYTKKRSVRRHIQSTHLDISKNTIHYFIRECSRVCIPMNTMNSTSSRYLMGSTKEQSQPYSINQFLQETCHPKPFKTYVNDGTFELSMNDITQMEYTGVRDGYIHIFKRFFRKMPLALRPFHCTDKKRRTFYYMDDSCTWRRDKECIHIETCIDEVKYALIQCINNWVKTIKDQDQFLELRTPHKSNQYEKATTYIRVICLGDTEKEERLNKKRIIQSIVPDIHITKQDIPCRIYNSL